MKLMRVYLFQRTKVSRPLSSTFWLVWCGIFAVLGVSGCGGLGKGTYKKAPTTSAENATGTVTGTIETKEAAAPVGPLPSARLESNWMVILRCEPKSQDADHEPLIREISWEAFHTYLEGVPSGIREAVSSSAAVIFERVITVEVQGTRKEVPLSYLVPVDILRKVAPTGDMEAITSLIYHLGLPMPPEIFLHLLEQSAVPRFDDPVVYATNREKLLEYLAFSKQLQDHLRQERLSPDNLAAALRNLGLDPEDIEFVLKYTASNPDKEKEKSSFVLSVMFISPDNCGYHLPMEVNLPPFGWLVPQYPVPAQLPGEIPVPARLPGEIIERVWGRVKIKVSVWGHIWICPSPTPESTVYYKIPGGGPLSADTDPCVGKGKGE